MEGAHSFIHWTVDTPNRQLTHQTKLNQNTFTAENEHEIIRLSEVNNFQFQHFIKSINMH